MTMNTVSCTFATASKNPLLLKSYTYKTFLSLTKGDLVVVPVCNSLNFKVCRVTEVHKIPQIDPKALFDYAWIVDKINPVNLVKWEKQMAKERGGVCATVTRL